MKLDSQIAKLICELEYLIGSQCYNPNSYDGFTGEEGREFRYPVYSLSNCDSSKLFKFRHNIACSALSFSERTVNTMKYTFGSNHLFIGRGIKKILMELEHRYDLDFNELERLHSEKLKNAEQAKKNTEHAKENHTQQSLHLLDLL